MQSKIKQYEYRANSNLVLMADRSDRPRLGSEPTGEPETLRGKIKGAMGDRVMFGKPPEDVLNKMRERAKSNRQKEAKLANKVRGASNVLNVKISKADYKPKTRETKAVYETILDQLQKIIVDNSSSVLESCVDELLYLFKKENLIEQDRKRSVIELLGITDKNEAEQIYTKLFHLAKKITDYVEDEDEEDGEEDTDIPLVFDKEPSSDDEQYIVKEDSEDDEDDESKAETNQTVLKAADLEGNEQEEEEEGSLDPRNIDAFWIQREVSKFESDKLVSQKIAQQILDILQNSKNLVDCENSLVDILGYDHFDFVKVLLSNQRKILFCTLLKQSQSNSEKENIRSQMQADPQLSHILDIIEGKNKSGNQTTRKSAKVNSNIRKEFQMLKKKEKMEDDDEMVDQPIQTTSRKIIDLESVTFHQGGHLMSNKSCHLPQGSVKHQKKGYDEVFIPSLEPAPINPSELVPITDIPEWARPPFHGLPSLNRVQSRLFRAAFYGADNMLICAPTGSGKTVCALLTMLHEIGLNRLSNGEIDLNSFKIIYISPMKSLVREQVGEFTDRLSHFGITARELTGDINLTKQQIAETQVIFTTPEKWDIITRKSGDRTFTQLVRLLIVDEIHLLHDQRGAVLESIIARTIRQIESTQEMVRIVGLSATLPNYEDVATFCRVKAENVFAFDNTYRTVPLEQQYIGITEKKALKRYQLMNKLTYEKVLDYAGEHQVLVFVHSRKDTIKTGKMIRDMAMANDEIGKFLQNLKEVGRAVLNQEAENKNLSSADLKELLPYGIAIHHAGMTRFDRGIVEDLFRERYIQVLVSTATLAWGVNLPARAVIIKGTEVYNPEKGAWTELSSMDVMQMLGRAGRNGFDTKGEGILITSNNELQFYLSLMNSQLPIESQFLSSLVDNMNAEIVMGSIQNLQEAATWLGYTYLYICMLRSPTLYGISFEEYEADPELDERRLDLAHTAATLLDKYNLIKYDRKTGEFQVTNLGRVASHYYVSYTSIATYNEHLKPTTSDIDLFRLFSLSEEFKFITVRQEEKIELEKLLDTVPIPVKESVDEPSAKVNVLLQSYISRLSLEGFALAADMVYVTQSAARIMRALFGIVLQRGWAQLAERILLYSKMIHKRMWASQSPLRQFSDIPLVIIKRLEATNIPFERLYDLNLQEIFELISAKEMARSVFNKIHQYPRLELSAQVQPITPSIIKIDLKIMPDFKFDEHVHGKSQAFWVFVEDVNGEQLLHHEYFILKSKYAADEHYLTFTVPLFDPLPPQYFIRVISDSWLGPDAVLPVSFRHLILPAKYPPHTELLDLQPISISNLKNSRFESFYVDRFKHFNAIQTQVFHCLYQTAESALIAAPTGSGKTVCAELAIFKALNDRNADDSDEEDQKKAKQGHPKIIYIAPLESLAQERYVDWNDKFQSIGVNVTVLTGEFNVDIKLLSQNDIIISTPEQWDILARRWVKRVILRNIGLFIVDELHLISGNNGHTIEVITSRMRRMAHTINQQIRIIGLSTSIANAKSIGEWIGASNKSIFNFHPHTRPIPVEIHLKGFDDTQFEYRMIAMSKPVVNALVQHGNQKPVIIFTPSRQQALRTANDIKIYCDSSENREQFLRCTKEDLQPHIEALENQFLKELLPYGIGFYHEHLTESEKSLVERLFEAEAIQIFIATRSLCWGLNLSSHMVIIMGTEYYDGKEHRYIDYPIADVLQMIGRANRPGIDTTSKCFLLCHSARKEFYKKFLFEPLPVESHLDLFLPDHLNSEIFSTTIKDTEDCIDFLTWTLLYRRLTQNPNYYNLKGVTHQFLCDHLSELVETTLQQLEEAGCVTLHESEQESDGNMSIEPMNPGIIAGHYFIRYDTMELFTSSLSKNTKLKGLIEILSNAKEFSDLPIRHREPGLLHRIAGHVPVKIEATRFNEAPVKVNVLLQAHFSRILLKADLHADQKVVLTQILKLIYGMVDIITTIGALKPALSAMELAQMVVQGMWVSDPIIKQLPFFTEEIIERCKAHNVTRIEDITDLEDDQRNQLLQLSDRQMAKVAEACNRYPDIEVEYQLDDDIQAAKPVNVQIALSRDIEEDEDIGFVIAPHFPKSQVEQWWIVIGDQKEDKLIAIKRVSIQRELQTSISFDAPPNPGHYKYNLMVVCDSYIGCDQEYEFEFDVNASQDSPAGDVKEEEAMQD